MNILTWDSTLTDVCVPISRRVDKVARFKAFLEKRRIVFDNKTYIADPVFDEIFGRHFVENNSDVGPLIKGSDELLELTDGIHPEVGTGGSTSNLGATFMKAMKDAGRDDQFNYVTINASDRYGAANRRFLENAGITVWPQNLPAELTPPVSSISLAYIVGFATTYATHDTGVKSAMREEYVTKKLMDESDMVIMPGSSARKFGDDFFRHTRALQEDRNNYRIYVLPSGERAARQYRELSRDMMLRADGIISNYVEMGATLIPEKASSDIHPDEVAEVVQKQLRFGHEIAGRRLWKDVQFVIMSKGKFGASIITPETRVDQSASTPVEWLSTGGAGDCLGGMAMAALAQGMCLEDVAKMGVYGATGKIETTFTSVQEKPIENVRRRDFDLIERFRARSRQEVAAAMA